MAASVCWSCFRVMLSTLCEIFSNTNRHHWVIDGFRDAQMHLEEHRDDLGCSGVLRQGTQHLISLGSPSPHLPGSGHLQKSRVVPETWSVLCFCILLTPSLGNRPCPPPGFILSRLKSGGTRQASRDVLVLPLFPPASFSFFSSIRNEFTL